MADTKLEQAIREAEALIKRALVLSAARKGKPSDMPFCRTRCEESLCEALVRCGDALRWEEQAREMIGSRSAGRKPTVKVAPVAVSG